MNTTIDIINIDEESNGYIDKINKDIGFYWWKRYIYSAFWSNISTPINLSIVILTAITTGQNATQHLISDHVSIILGIVVLFISIFNTFFKPYEQMTHNQEILQNWSEVGEQFDEIYYDRVYTVEEKQSRLLKLETLFKSMSSLKRANDNNYLIDMIYLMLRLICIRNIGWNDTLNNSSQISQIRQRRESLVNSSPRTNPVLINTDDVINI